MKGREIANVLDLNKKEVNSYLYKNKSKFRINSNNQWFNLQGSSHTLELEGDTWVNADSFESSLLNSGCLLSSKSDSYTIILPKECKPLLESIARLLAISNQLNYLGNKVEINLKECKATKSYLNRIGFFDLLHPDIVVKPRRPKRSTARIYRGNNESVVELGEIDPKQPERALPKMLKKSFVAEAGEEYQDAAFTFFSELFDNICEHSETPIPGFAALQVYGKNGNGRHHIQVVVSDSGKGIVETLKPVLKKYYPELHRDLDFTHPESNALLLEKVLLDGRITRKGDPEETGRGLGLKRSADYAPQYNARISVRQEAFELKIFYKNGAVRTRSNKNLPRILGTHICFDFYLS
ncbi:MAG: hypothetical protein JKY22_00275 [Flavobacteriaceae bacterium]|nr:hypothetical protein [Flavobacteriaceae bacterium]